MPRARRIVLGLVLCASVLRGLAAQGAPERQLARVTSALAAFRKACTADGGRLWGRSLDGPILVVDLWTRRVVASRADEEGRLAPRDDLFVGSLPEGFPAESPLDWAGVRWAVVPVRLVMEGDPVAAMIHESFHRLQPELGLAATTSACEHLDRMQGRLWMLLEWRALLAGLCAAGAERTAYVRDALDFRAARRLAFPGTAALENALEIREGLAQYTGDRVLERGPEEIAADVALLCARSEGLELSFAYASGPLYGSLLDAAGVPWRSGLTATSDLGVLLAGAHGLAPDPARAGEEAVRHGGDELRVAEERREREREAELARWRATLVEGPVLELDLTQLLSVQPEHDRGRRLEPGRTVHTERVLEARWGVLRVSGGAVLEDASTGTARVSLLDAAPDRESGPGWTLVRAPGWRLVPGAREGDLALRADQFR